MKALIYTQAFDRGPVPRHRWMVQLMIASLRRSGYAGDVMIFTDSEEPLYARCPLGVEQVRIDLPPEANGTGAMMRAKYLAGCLLPRGYDWIGYIDDDCIVLRNPIEHLPADAAVVYAEEPWHPLSYPFFNAYLTDSEMAAERPGINAGVWFLRGDGAHDFLRAWAENDARSPLREKVCQEQPAFARTVLDCGARARAFGGDFRIVYPDCTEYRMAEQLRAGLVHFAAITTEEKLRRMLGYTVMQTGESLAPFLAELTQG